MQKIMFNDRYGLTEAVLEGRKTMTRRIIKCPKKATYLRLSKNKAGNWWSITMHGGFDRQIGVLTPHYKIGEIVAIAQAYKDVGSICFEEWQMYEDWFNKGFNNKIPVNYR